MDLHTRLHDCCNAGRTAFGVNFALTSAASVEIVLSRTDFDFTILDLQHSHMTPPEAVQLLRAAQVVAPQATPMVRLPSHDVWWIEQCLDAGFTGIVAPIVESREQAETLVARAFYAPKGERSIAGVIRSNAVYDDYVAASDDIFLLPQIESVAGVENFEAILGTDGVSGVLFGPRDLSQSYGWQDLDLLQHQPFVDIVDRLVAAANAAGKIVATMVFGKETAAWYRDHGLHAICYCHDHVELAINTTARWQDELADLRRGQT
ncbi:MAG: HpcH/HpaI aldolase family protein [Lentisphaeria bacterium]